MMNVQTLKTCLKREYWEYKRTLYLVPIVLSVLIFMAALAAEMYVSHVHGWALEQAGHAQMSSGEDADAPESNSDQDEDERDRDRDGFDDSDFRIQMGKSPVEFVSIYLGLAWLVGLYYLLSSLYTDRRDNSILYWKSMPVSETTSTLTKLLFGALAFVAASLLAAWLMYIVFHVLGWGSMETDSDGNVVRIEQAFQPIKLFFWPLHGVIGGLLWGAPVFGYCMLVSAFAKQARFLWLIVPLIIVSVVEGIFLQSRNAFEFLLSHMPHVALETLQSSESVGEFWQQLFGPMLPSMILGWLLATAFVVMAIWCRNNRFEV